MLGRTYESEVCSIARALEVVGERWSVLIVRNALFAGSTRFSDFQRSLGIATNILQNRLDGFVAAGILRPGGSPRRGGGPPRPGHARRPGRAHGAADGAAGRELNTR